MQAGRGREKREGREERGTERPRACETEISLVVSRLRDGCCPLLRGGGFGRPSGHYWVSGGAVERIDFLKYCSSSHASSPSQADLSLLHCHLASIVHVPVPIISSALRSCWRTRMIFFCHGVAQSCPSIKALRNIVRDNLHDLPQASTNKVVPRFEFKLCGPLRSDHGEPPDSGQWPELCCHFVLLYLFMRFVSNNTAVNCLIFMV